MGTFAYNFTGLLPGATYALRLHFAEIYWDNAGQRQFHVRVNGSQVSTNLDIFAEAGGKFTALVRQFNVVADPSGSIQVSFLPGAADQPKSSGIELGFVAAQAKTADRRPHPRPGGECPPIVELHRDGGGHQLAGTGALVFVGRRSPGGFNYSSFHGHVHLHRTGGDKSPNKHGHHSCDGRWVSSHEYNRALQIDHSSSAEVHFHRARARWPGAGMEFVPGKEISTAIAIQPGGWRVGGFRTVPDSHRAGCQRLSWYPAYSGFFRVMQQD